MENVGTIIVLVAFVIFCIGLLGVVKGNVKALQIPSRKVSALVMGAAFIGFIIGGAMLPTEPVSKSVTEDTPSTSPVEEQVQDDTKEQQAPVISQDNPSAGEMQVHFVDVGQGAAQIIITPTNKVMVIDGGNNDDEDKMVAYLTELGVSKIDILIGTHPDADHIGGIDAVIDAFDIGKIYMPKVQRDTQTFASVLQAIQNKGLKVTTAKAGLMLDLDPAVQVTMISPVDETHSDANELSAVVRLQYGEHAFLLTGDAGIKTEEKWLQSGERLQSTVLLVGHHGSEYSTSEALLQAVQPQYAVIQVGKNNYGHPTSEVLDRLHANNIGIYRNDTDGTIVFKTDGKEMQINKDAWAYTATPPSKSHTSPPAPPVKETEHASSLQASATIDTVQPTQNEEVTVTVTVKDQAGNPVSGANVQLNLQFKSKDTDYEAITNANGMAEISFRIGRAAAGFTVDGEITVTANGMTATTQTAFTPK